MNRSPGSPWRPRRASSSVSRCSGPTDAVPVRTGRPSVVWASIVADVVARGRQRRLDLLAGNDHVPEVGADAAVLEPRLAPHRDGERVELAEVRRPFDRGAGESERRRGVPVVDARVAVVGLFGQHLGRRPHGPGQRDLGGEAHPRDATVQTRLYDRRTGRPKEADMRTRFTELVGTELPIVQAPMAGASDARLAAAVANAGGLGSLPCRDVVRRRHPARAGRLPGGVGSPGQPQLLLPRPARRRPGAPGRVARAPGVLLRRARRRRGRRAGHRRGGRRSTRR